MKKSINFSEIMLWLVMLLPFGYLAMIWSGLPETVPTHFNIKGEPDGWGSKSTLIWVPAFLVVLGYGLTWLIPKIDPKRKIEQMGEKYERLRWVIIGLMSALSCVIIFSAQSEGGAISNQLITIVLGLAFVLLGNYFQTIRHNYFIGIRTPWTLENETVWKNTHRMAGKWWMLGGLAVILAALLLPNDFVMPIFLVITGVITLVPIVYSYLEYKKLGKATAG